MKLKSKSHLSPLKAWGLICLLCWLAISPTLANSILQNKISISAKNTPLSRVLEDIESKTDYSFLVRNNDVNLDECVSIEVKNKTVSEVLNELFRNKHIKYEIAGQSISVFIPQSNPVVAQKNERVITGSIIDAQGESIIGANVVVKGSTIGTITDIDGNFTLTVSNGQSLEVSYIGYLTKKILITDKTSFKIQLTEDTQNLTEVVVVGYGTVKKGDLTGAIASIRNEDISKYATGTVGNALQGQMAGVEVTSKSGKPGAGVDIKIRGTSSLGNSAPLYLIDGIPTDINNVSPNDIESIEILKDGAAAAIYGSRAANGVVLITTKRARAGKSTITLNSYFGVDALAKKIPVMNAEQHVRTMNQAYINAGREPFYPNSPESYGKGTDWSDEFYSTAPIQNYNIGFSEGSDNAKVSASIDYFDQDGIALNTGFERTSARINSEFKNGKFTFVENLTGFISKARNENMNAVWRTLEMPSTVPIYDEKNIGGFGGTYGDMFDIMSPIAAQNLIKSTTERDYIQGSFSINYEAIKKLNIKLNTGGTVSDNYNYSHTKVYDLGTLKNPLASMSEDRGRQVNWLVEGTADYELILKNHNFKFLLGISAQKDSYRNTKASGKGMPNNDIDVLGAATQDITASGTEWNHTLASQFARVNYNFADRYLASLTVRRDGSSRFGVDNRWGIFPSASLAWRLSNEAFYPKEAFINDAKIRLSYGELGNQEIGNYSFSAMINSSLHYPFGTGQILSTGSSQVDLASPSIKWETNVSKNIGVDLVFADNAWSLSLDYFINNSKDLLVRVPIPMSNASNLNPYQNIGEIRNQGFELTTGWRKEVNDFKINISATISSVDNKVLKLGNGEQTIWAGKPYHLAENTTLTKEGGKVASFHLIKTDGVFQSQEEIDNYTHTEASGKTTKIQPNAVPGDMRFVDSNNDGKIDASDRVYCGSAMPDLSYGFNLGIGWKNFDLSTFIQGSVGNKIFNGTAYTIEGLPNFNNMSTRLLDAWTEDNHSNIPRVTRTDINQNNRTSSDRFLEDGSYLRMKSLQLGYTIAPKVLERIYISNARVYVAAQNIFTITGYKGYDPDIYSGNLTSEADALLNRGVDSGIYPPSRTFRIGFQLTF